MSLFTPRPTPTPTPTPTPVKTPTPAPVLTPSPEAPTPAPTVELRGRQEIQASGIKEDLLPSYSKLDLKGKIVAHGEASEQYKRLDSINAGHSSEYSLLEGVTTFRGNNYRDSAAYGTVPAGITELEILYKISVGKIDKLDGIGWTGQPAIVKWPEETLAIMNIKDEKRAKAELVEVIYAALDGKIYFFDLEDGEPTRDPIDIKMPIRGSVTVDPRGYPLLYVGQGTSKVNNKNVETGIRVFSLIDHSVLLLIEGKDDLAKKDAPLNTNGSPLVDANSDTLIWPGGNGIIYTVKLNTDFNTTSGTIAISPIIDKYQYTSKVSKRDGTESSPVLYNHYALFGDNSGLLHCLDLNTLNPVWIAYTQETISAAPAIEELLDGRVTIYMGSRFVLKSGSRGKSVLRAYDLLTGTEIWRNDKIEVQKSDNTGGLFASPAIGQGNLSQLVFYNMARTKDGGTLYALSKSTGDSVWDFSLKSTSLSSPVIVYDEEERGSILVGASSGNLFLVEGLEGTSVLAQVKLEGSIDGSPAVYNDIAVVGTRGGTIYGIRLK
jgi:outer membrane protein assembly factor BamB